MIPSGWMHQWQWLKFFQSWESRQYMDLESLFNLSFTATRSMLEQVVLSVWVSFFHWEMGVIVSPSLPGAEEWAQQHEFSKICQFPRSLCTLNTSCMASRTGWNKSKHYIDLTWFILWIFKSYERNNLGFDMRLLELLMAGRKVLVGILYAYLFWISGLLKRVMAN